MVDFLVIPSPLSKMPVYFDVFFHTTNTTSVSTCSSLSDGAQGDVE